MHILTKDIHYEAHLCMFFVDDKVLVDDNTNTSDVRYGRWRVELEKYILKRYLKCRGLKKKLIENGRDHNERLCGSQLLNKVGIYSSV